MHSFVLLLLGEGSLFISVNVSLLEQKAPPAYCYGGPKYSSACRGFASKLLNHLGLAESAYCLQESVVVAAVCKDV